uniref:I/LWEQ domain-containing protein n=1 Tax=Electrophorus electricus TaxID=8005 RepID=A0A4W4HBG9_ELEEL
MLTYFLFPQLQSIGKCMTPTEAPIKEKYARTILLGTHKEGGAVTFWSHAVSLPLASSAIVSWKFCHLLHKVLRDGHPNVSARKPLSGTLHDRYGHIVALYAKYLCIKIEFHCKVSLWLNMVTSEIMQNASLYIKGMTSVACDMHFKVLGVFSVMWVLLLYFCARDAVFRQLESNSTSSATPVGQCRLSPLVPVIQDCGPLYHFLVKLLFKLHSLCLVPFILLSLTQFFEKSRSIEFFKTLIQIPDLPDSPPNFLRAASLADHVKPVVVQNLEQLEDDDTETQVDFDFHSGFHGHFVHVLRDTEVVSLRKELEAVKPELHIFKAEAQRAVVHLKEQVNKLEAELEDQRTQKQMAMVENECLRMEHPGLRQRRRAQTVQVQFSRLKEKHAELVSRHADLMRKNADAVKQLASTQQAQEEVVRAKEQMAVELEQLKQEKSVKVDLYISPYLLLSSFSFVKQPCRNHVFQAGDEMSSVLVGLQAEKEALLRSMREQEAELSSLRQSAHQHQATLLQEREKTQREMGALQIQLQAKSSQEYLLQQKLQEEQFCLLQCAVVEAEGIILDAVAKVDDPMHVCCVCTPGTSSFPDVLAKAPEPQKSFLTSLTFLKPMGHQNASGLLRAVTQFSHLAADTIVNGAATAHAVPTDQADRLTDSCRDCATHCLQFLRELKLKATLPKADPTAIRYVIQRILSQGQNLRHTDQDAQKAELADLVDMEMTATSTAIEDAVLRMDEILNQAKRDTSGIKLEVNQRLSRCNLCFPQAIHMLITAATDLQKDVVESGRGAGSAKDFYAKNSCWTEGLISASKAVGWGASRMVESADKVVTDQGKYEELIVCSHEIAASTAQLVAASKVKADRGNKKLHTLQQASRHVNDMAAVVVTSTKTGQMQIEYKDPLDFSGISLIKLKTEEMDSQVRVLELESQLCQERQRLGELRKRHYELAGLSPDQPEEGDFSGFVSVLPPVVPDPPLPELQTPEPPQATPLKVTPSKATPHKVPSKKPSIFQKSGTLLKSAVTLYLVIQRCYCFHNLMVVCLYFEICYSFFFLLF